MQKKMLVAVGAAEEQLIAAGYDINFCSPIIFYTEHVLLTS